MKKPVPVYLLIFLLIFQVISAIPAGWVLILDPSGAKLGLPLGLLESSPFSDFLIPGLFLFLALGIFPLFIVYGLIKKNTFRPAERINLYKEYHWSWTLSYYFGLILITWINMELLFIREFSIFQFVYSTLGILIVFVSQLPGTKHYYKIQS